MKKRGILNKSPWSAARKAAALGSSIGALLPLGVLLLFLLAAINPIGHSRFLWVLASGLPIKALQCMGIRAGISTEGGTFSIGCFTLSPVVSCIIFLSPAVAIGWCVERCRSSGRP
jgi:hypothetical protein